jgi:oligopeptide transport system substrate-binding protein
MIPRRALLAAGPLALAGCGAGDTYFGRTDPPSKQRLVCALNSDPDSLDPALSTGRVDQLMLSLFEGLTSMDPARSAPMAGVATHYDISAGGLRYTFCLRGHPDPAGTPLPCASDLSAEYSRGGLSPSYRVPARWSDGTELTAHDFVYSWKRVLQPETAAPNAYMLYPIRNSREVNAGTHPAESLGVKAVDRFTLEVELRAPTPYFPELVSAKVFCPTPRHAIRQLAAGWTQTGTLVCNGPFVLYEKRAGDRIVLRRNPHYYDAAQVALQELVFEILPDSATTNMYRAGALMIALPAIPAILPALRRRKDFEGQPKYASDFLVINTRRPPLDDPRVRWALNMATDKVPLAGLEFGGSIPTKHLVPATPGYPQSAVLEATVDGAAYDILSFNPQAARDLLQRAGLRLPKRVEYICPGSPDSEMIAQVLQQQWRKNLDIELEIRTLEMQVWIDSFHNGTFRHIAEGGSAASYMDPTWFLELFAEAGGYGSGWSDPEYSEMLRAAGAVVDRTARLAKLADCERHLLRAMPVLPLAHEVWPILKKPFVKGMGNNPLGRDQFKYAWIDTNWRPQ